MKKQRAIEIINEIICIILKIDKYERLVDKLKKIMSETFFENQQTAIEEAIQDFINTEGLITDKDKTELLEILERRLGTNIATLLEAKMNEIRRETYSLGLSEINIEYGFNRISKETLNWLEQNHSYWIGNFYKEQIADRLGKDLDDIFDRILKEGMSREAAGRYLKEMLKDRFGKPGFKGTILNYYEGFANHVITQTREFAHIDAYERAGIEYVKIQAVLDSRTSLICRELNGRVIAVSKLKQQRDKILNSKSPEEAKKYSKWLTQKEIMRLVYQKATEELPDEIGLPPYHFHCRTTTVMAYQEEIERDLLKAKSYQQFENILKSKVDNYEQLSKAEISRLKTIALNASADNEYIYDMIRSAQSDIYLIHIRDKLQSLFVKQQDIAIWDIINNKLVYTDEKINELLNKIEEDGGKYMKLKKARGIKKWIKY